MLRLHFAHLHKGCIFQWSIGILIIICCEFSPSLARNISKICICIKLFNSISFSNSIRETMSYLIEIEIEIEIILSLLILPHSSLAEWLPRLSLVCKCWLDLLAYSVNDIFTFHEPFPHSALVTARSLRNRDITCIFSNNHYVILC